MLPRHAARVDLAPAADVLVDAFSGDPWFGWLYPSADAWPEHPRQWFALVLDRAFSKGHTFVAESGVATWIPPDVKFPEEADANLAVDLLSSHLGERAAEAFGVLRQAGGVFPDQPRFHCVYVGVARTAQGRGTGRALLTRVLEVCDRDRLPASLTSTNDTNLPWYRSLGFREIGEIAVPDAQFSLRPMWREPAGG
jgi:GNAT superfamily N-acetyltransferase